MLKKGQFLFTAPPPGCYGKHEFVCGDAIRMVGLFPDASVRCWVTSPPYFHQVDYGVDNQVGQESTVEEYLAYQTGLAVEMLRKTMSDGVLFWVIRDSYNGSGGAGGDYKENGRYRFSQRGARVAAYPRKSQLLIPELTRIALTKAGWIPRLDIIWNKQDSRRGAQDRPSYSHEHVYVFSKSPDHIWNREAVLQEFSTNRSSKERPGAYLRSIWCIPSTTQPRVAGERALAAFPLLLAEICVNLGSNEGDLVVDPYCGFGTTLLAAKKWGRNSIGIDINPQYNHLIELRIVSELLAK